MLGCLLLGGGLLGCGALLEGHGVFLAAPTAYLKLSGPIAQGPDNEGIAQCDAEERKQQESDAEQGENAHTEQGYRKRPRTAQGSGGHHNHSHEHEHEQGHHKEEPYHQTNDEGHGEDAQKTGEVVAEHRPNLVELEAGRKRAVQGGAHGAHPGEEGNRQSKDEREQSEDHAEEHAAHEGGIRIVRTVHG